MTVAMIEMADGARLRTWTSEHQGPGRSPSDGRPERLPVVLVHGGPGVPDYLGPVAAMIDDSGPVHRYDQRGVGGSAWVGDFTIDQSVDDLAALLDAWGHDRVIMIGHSFGTDVVSFFLLAHPGRVAGMIYLAGPFLGDWREPTRATERARRSDAQQRRLQELDRPEPRSETDEIEFLTLSWFTDHADRDHAWDWARAAAREQRPVNYAMNAQLNADKKVRTLESQLDRLHLLMPAGSVIIGGAGDSRPAAALQTYGPRIGAEVIIVDGAGHQPWLERPAEFETALGRAVSRWPRPRTGSP